MRQLYLYSKGKLYPALSSLLLLMGIFIYFSGSAQAPECKDLNCTANDVQIVKAYFTGANGQAISCPDGGGTVDGYLHVVLSTNTPRKGVSVSGNLLIDGKATSIGACFDNDLKGSSNDLVFPTAFKITCTSTAYLANSLVSWGVGNGQYCGSTAAQCPATKSKCRYTAGQIPVSIKLEVFFDWAAGDCTLAGNGLLVKFTPSISLENVAITSYAWNFGDGTVTSTDESPTYTYVNEGTYDVTLTVTGTTKDGNNTSITKSITLPVTVAPCCNLSAPVIGPFTFCKSQNKTFGDLPQDDGDGGAYNWFDENDNGLKPEDVIPVGSHTYYVSLAKGNCTSAKAKVSVTVTAAPNAGSNGTLTICEGSTPTTTQLFNALGGSPASDGSWAPTLMGAGTYTYTIAGTATCADATSQVVVTTQAAPNAGTSGSLKLCAGSTPTETQLSDAITGEDAGGTWSEPVGNVYTYTVTATAPCAVNATSTVTVSFDPLPIASAGGSATICSNGTATVSGASSSNGTIAWTEDGAGSITLGAATLNPTYTAASGDAGHTVTLTMAVTSNNTCGTANATATYTITVSPNANSGTVSGSSPLCIGAIATYSSDGDAGGTWSSSDTTVATISSVGLLTAKKPGTTTISYIVTGCNAVAATKLLTVSPNTICPAYTGIYFTNTSSTTSGGTATFNLTYTISSAGCNGKNGLTAANFTATSSADPSSTTVAYGTKSYNSSTGLLTIPVTVKLGSSVYSAGVTFTLVLVNAPNYAIGSGCSDPILVTVSSKADGFVTGGGYIIPTDANGTIGLVANTFRTNFGFNIKYNKASTNLQGNWNMIIRTSTGLWQVKSSQPTYLAIKQISSTSYKADMVFSAANIKNLTSGTGYGTGTVNVTVYDNGEPGAGIDQIFIKVTDGASNYYTSSLSTNLSTSSSVKKLNQGNIQIHTLGIKATLSAVTQVSSANATIEQVPTTLTVSAYPNPYSNNVRFVVNNPKAGLGSLEVFNILGQKVKTVYQGFIPAGSQSYQMNGNAIQHGNLLYRLSVGNTQVTGKLLHAKE